MSGGREEIATVTGMVEFNEDNSSDIVAERLLRDGSRLAACLALFVRHLHGAVREARPTGQRPTRKQACAVSGRPKSRRIWTCKFPVRHSRTSASAAWRSPATKAAAWTGRYDW